jgi:hypothetical protein
MESLTPDGAFRRDSGRTLDSPIVVVVVPDEPDEFLPPHAADIRRGSNDESRP